jgi:hypothetical protein
MACEQAKFRARIGGLRLLGRHGDLVAQHDTLKVNYINLVSSFSLELAGSREAPMMPKINRLTGRFFTVLISLSVAIFLPRAVMAGEAIPPPPLASPAGADVLAALRLNLLTAPLAGGASGPTLCQISDTVYRADGSPAQGTVLISWQAFTTAAGQAVTPGSLLVTLDANGGFNASLAPNTGASLAGSYYKAIFKLNEVKAHMRCLVGNGNEGKIQELQEQVTRHEAFLQRFTGISAALACLLTVVHFAIDLLKYKR